MSQTDLQRQCGRLFRRVRCDKSLPTLAGPNPGQTPGFGRDFMDQHLTFGHFSFEPATARLWERGSEVRLTRKAAQVLGALLARPGVPVS